MERLSSSSWPQSQKMEKLGYDPKQASSLKSLSSGPVVIHLTEIIIG